MDAVSQQRLREDIERTGTFGALDVEEGHGRTVLAGTEANRRARDYFVDQLEAAGLTVRVDAVGTIVGRWTPPSADPDAAPVAAGSHLDSVPEGGIFDGPLGVYGALESVRAMQDADLAPERPIEVVCFTEEEGARFANGLLGSSVATGVRSADAVLTTTDGDGTTLETALDRIGYRGEGRVDASEWDAWVELHVSQDTRLEAADRQAGIVTTITGITHCEATIEGQADHAGATPMDGRTDALAAAGEFITDLERAAEEAVAADSDTAVATVGSCSVSPNATNVVPGRVELGVDIRDVDYEVMNDLCRRARSSLARLESDRGVETAFERSFDVEPAPMADRVRGAFADAADAAGMPTMDLHSGAAHDTMHVARATDAGLLFAPSVDGISHNPKEWTDWSDCAAATRVLAGAVARLSGAQ